MPESRDRLPRPDEVTAMFVRRRQSIRSMGILSDEPEVGLGTPFRWGRTAMTGAQGQMGSVAATRGGGGGGLGRGSFGTPRNAASRGRNFSRSPAIGLQNTPAAGSGRRGQRGRGGMNSVLPSWYPRTPLRDITAVVRAIERRRARLREIEGQQNESPLSREQIVPDPSLSTSGVHLEHNNSIISPNPTTEMKKPCLSVSVGKVPKILLDITKRNAGEPDCLTPQKKLLNSLDTVEKAVMDELRRLKRTPSAKKVEREKRVRTLMSMR